LDLLFSCFFKSLDDENGKEISSNLDENNHFLLFFFALLQLNEWFQATGLQKNRNRERAGKKSKGETAIENRSQ
jgi:hypothetical protein